MAVHRRQHQRRDAQLAAGPAVDLGAVLQQEFDDVDVASGGGQRERRVVGDVAVLLVGSSVKGGAVRCGGDESSVGGRSERVGLRLGEKMGELLWGHKHMTNETRMSL